MLRALACARLSLAAALRRRWVLLRSLRICRRKARCSMWLLAAGKSLDVVMTQGVAVSETGGTRVGIVETPLGLAITVVLSTEITKVGTLALVLHLSELSERAVRAVLVLPCGWSGGMEVRRLGLTEVVGWSAEILSLGGLLLLLLLLRDRSGVLLLLRLDLIKVGWETVLAIRMVHLALRLLRLVTGEGGLRLLRVG